MNKRAVADETLKWFMIRFVFTLIIIVIIATLVNGAIKNKLDTEDLRFYPVAERVLYSRECFIYIDGERAYPGIISSSRFSQRNLEACMGEGRETLSAKITLSYNGNAEVVYFKQDLYKDLLPISFSNIYNRKVRRYFVLVEKDGRMLPGNLEIDVVWRA